VNAEKLKMTNESLINSRMDNQKRSTKSTKAMTDTNLPYLTKDEVQFYEEIKAYKALKAMKEMKEKKRINEMIEILENKYNIHNIDIHKTIDEVFQNCEDIEAIDPRQKTIIKSVKIERIPIKESKFKLFTLF